MPGSPAPPDADGPLARADRFIGRLESVGTALASLALFAIMLIVFFDVGRRYIFNSPLGWSYDLISLYLMVAVFFLSLSATQRDNHHVRVDILLRSAPPRLRHVLMLAGYLLTVVVMAGIFYQNLVKFWTSYQANDAVGLVIAWPTWISVVMVPIGVGLLILRLLFEVVSLATAAAAGTADVVGVREITDDDGAV